MTKDDLTPATKKDLHDLEVGVDRKLQEMDERIDRRFQEMEDRILRHFDLAVETIRSELLGANRDELELVKDRQRNHDQRIRVLERSAGLISR